MDSVFEELRRAREARHLTIEDVSDATLINPKLLEAIERGNTNVLPQTYVRAFIREYASFVGLDPSEIMRRYDQANAESQRSQEGETRPPPETASTTKTEKPQTEPGTRQPVQLASALSKYALPLIVVIALGIVVWNLTRTRPTPPEEEASVGGVIASPQSADSAGTSVTVAKDTRRRAADSLTLRAVVSDSAWVQITIDDLEPMQYVFRPNRRIEWKALNRFRMSTGNAGAVDLTLNNTHLGVLGKRRAIVRNVEFNRQTLQSH